MQQKINYIRMNHMAYGWKTVVVDSVTFYADIWVGEVLQKYKDRGKEPVMNQRDWGLLEEHICKDIAQKLHGLPMNVIWTALATDKYGPEKASGERPVTGSKPYIQGKSAIKLPAICKMVIYAAQRKEIINGRVTTIPAFFTSKEAAPVDVDIRHKYGNCFPEGYLIDPDTGSTWPSFKAFDSRIGNFIVK